MRIAISGAHATGKSTLIAELSRSLPHYVVADESYYALVAEGHAFSADPSPDDFERLLDRSCDALATDAMPDVLMDRCPADYLGYLIATPVSSSDAVPRWFARTATAIATLDLVVFVPIERPDRISVSAAERPRLRRRVDLALREILVEDTWGLSPQVLEVSGTPADRARQVLARLEKGATR
jgi:predicted ATPase